MVEVNIAFSVTMEFLFILLFGVGFYSSPTSSAFRSVVAYKHNHERLISCT